MSNLPMEAREVAILQVPPARPGMAVGGSQVVAAVLADGLARRGFPVALLAGTSERAASPSTIIGDNGVRYIDAFTLSPHALTSGVFDVDFRPAAAQALSRARLAFMFDRVFPVPPPARRYLMLGTVAYAFAEQAIGSPDWHDLIVPSQYMYDEVSCRLTVASRADRLSRVHIVPNAIDVEGLASVRPVRTATADRRTFRMLHPHRADERKGLDRSVQLLADLSKRLNVELVVVQDRSPTAEPFLYERAMEQARSLGVHERMIFEPWRRLPEVGPLYASVDLVLCLGRFPEGFGLVALEAIACGTPVLACSSGAQTHILPARHGCIVAPDDDQLELCRLAAHTLLSVDVGLDVERGARHIRTNFARDQFVDRILRLLD